jgi:hypothetical protein
MLDDPLAGIGDGAVTPAPRSKKKGFSASDMLAQGTSRRDVEKAKGEKTVGDRKRKTVYLPTDLIDEIDLVAKEKGYGVMDFYHWLIKQSWEMYQEGKIEPVITEQMRVVRALKVD